GHAHPKTMYRVGYADFGPRFLHEGIADRQILNSELLYGGFVPAVNRDHNHMASNTIPPPPTSAPLGTFVPWNLRNPNTGAETELARLSGGYIPFADSDDQRSPQDPRPSLEERYANREAWLQDYDAALETLISAGYLLPDFREEMR